MAVRLLLLLLLLNLLPFLPLSSSDDEYVMFSLISSLYPVPSDWSEFTHYCNWSYVKCDSTDTFVTTIDLNSQALVGRLPVDFNNLTQLKTLYLQENSFTGPLPSFSNMTSLEELYLDFNYFSSVPQDFLLRLSSLRVFSISKNPLLDSWQIPLYLSESSDLQTFEANNASIFGSIPDLFANLTSLKNLSLNHNNLSGSIPQSLTTLPVLQIFDVSRNNLTGLIPTFPPNVKFLYGGNPLLGKDISTGGPPGGNSSGKGKPKTPPSSGGDSAGSPPGSASGITTANGNPKKSPISGGMIALWLFFVSLGLVKDNY